MLPTLQKTEINNYFTTAVKINFSNANIWQRLLQIFIKKTICTFKIPFYCGIFFYYFKKLWKNHQGFYVYNFLI